MRFDQEAKIRALCLHYEVVAEVGAPQDRWDAGYQLGDTEQLDP
ncbi:hypothetical protein [Corynebacterium sp. zg254]|nr:hypothetical protein [Corynebacterium sp. zg254]